MGAWAEAYEHARAFVARMTLEEKVNVTRGFTDKSNTCAGNTGSVPRLDWNGLCLMDAGNGVRGTDMVSAWPSGLHVGAAWDKNLTYERGLWMAREFKAKGGKSFLITGPAFLAGKCSWPVTSERRAGPKRRAAGQDAIGREKLGRLLC